MRQAKKRRSGSRGSKDRGQKAGQAPAASRPAGPPSGSAPAGPQESFSRREKLLLAAILLVLYGFVATWGQLDFGDIMGYYDMGVDAALKGRLALEYTPDQVNLIDLIPYQGRYYLQWGPFPMALHLAARLAGLRLSDRVACILAGWLTSLIFFEMILMLRERYFPAFPKSAAAWFLFAFALGTPAALVTYRGTVYNESIGIAALSIAIGFWAFLRDQQRPTIGWALLCGVAVGAALLTRITVALYAVPFAAGLAATSWMEGRWLRRTAARLAIFALAVVSFGLMQMAYNQARFGSPFDFGIGYKPETTPGFKAFAAIRIPENLRHYLLSLPHLDRDFPWLDHTGWQPLEHTTRAEAMSSMILGSPFLLLAGLSWRIYRRNSRYPAGLKLAAAVAGGSGLLMFAVMLCFASASRRYMQDFVPALMILSFIGAGTIERPAALWRRWRPWAWVVLALTALLHAQIAFYQSFYTPTPDPNVMRTFVALAPAVRRFAPGPKLAEEEAIARNDLGTVYLQQRRFGEALEQFRTAHELLPGSERIEKNFRIAEQLAKTAR